MGRRCNNSGQFRMNKQQTLSYREIMPEEENLQSIGGAMRYNIHIRGEKAVEIPTSCIFRTMHEKLKCSFENRAAPLLQGGMIRALP